jgi:uncharacterized protein (DUF2147 family)
MRTLLYALLVLALAAPALANSGDDIAGDWVTGCGNGLVRIELDGSAATATLMRTLEPGMLDSHNPEPALRERALADIRLGEFLFAGSSWKAARFYDPGSGNYYKARLQLVDENHLQVRGYVGISLLGRSETWTRKSHWQHQVAAMLEDELGEKP